MVWFVMDQHGLLWFGLVCFGMVLLVQFGVGWGAQMTSEFIHEEISIMDYNGLS